MQYELRFYYIEKGRMADIEARMRDGLPPLLNKHGINVVGRWSVLAGPQCSMFIYLMAWKDNTERDTNWGGFYNDPEWWALRAETNAGTELVEYYDIHLLSPAISWLNHAEKNGLPALGALHELIVQPIANGQPKAAQEYLENTAFPTLIKHGGDILGSFVPQSGMNMPGIVSIISWPSFEARLAGWKAYWADEAIQTALKQQREQLGKYLLGRSDIYLLEPASFAPIHPSLGRIK
ncbi:NIPSNAP family protein [Acinetobacter sp. ANC 3813]|uniref:NIPSNAP family protein n=1 Tax=Acinetobacter sp. ANC 3813 TaxID=1977873 RepID=UPI000A355F9A|nr:NIPSNAP family protein [Acinetobacter sp. ANC 3813]OTG91929.1 hypothetical protein B9T34_00840 [Acinetobacter sp. ANC 3813]